MVITEAILVRIQSEPISGALEACQSVYAALDQAENDSEEIYEIHLEFMALFSSLVDAEIISSAPQIPELTGKKSTDSHRVNKFLGEAYDDLSSRHALAKYEKSKSRFSASIGATFSYSFSQGDLEKVQELLNQLRGLVAVSDKFEEDHRHRLLVRLEKLQVELHKKVADLDRLWGLVGEMGVVIGKFGEDAKPFVDRIREIAQIVWVTQARAEELPSGAGLPPLEDQNSSDET